jgi:hypothetical protein
MTEPIRARKRDNQSLATGLILIVVGVLFFLDRLDIADFGDLFQDWWPMVLVIIGIPKLLRRETVWSGLWMIGLGAWLEVTVHHVWGLTFGNSWPLLLILMGAGITLRALADTVGGNTKEERHEK